jgi:hypothetical protein
MLRRTSFFVATMEEEIEDVRERVDLEFLVLTRVAIRINEDFEIVVVKDDLIVRTKCREDMRLSELSGDVEVRAVPKHPHTSAIARRRSAGPWMSRKYEVQVAADQTESFNFPSRTGAIAVNLQS